MCPDNEGELEKRLEKLTQTLEAEKHEREQQGEAFSTRAMGWGVAGRVFSEFVAGIVVGAGLGWLFDWVLGTSPGGMIVFVILGFGSALWNIYLLGLRMQDNH